MPADEVFALAADFGKASAETAVVLSKVYQAGGEKFAQAWKANAAATSGSHAAQYPGFITSELKIALGIAVEVGPEARGQGDLGRVLELGTGPNPPHLDGLRALGPADIEMSRLADDALRGIFP